MSLPASVGADRYFSERSALSPLVDAPYVLALLSLDGVGRVTAHRLIEHFPTYDALRATPREQVLLRLKGLPHAERTVGLLFDETAFGGGRGPRALAASGDDPARAR